MKVKSKSVLLVVGAVMFLLFGSLAIFAWIDGERLGAVICGITGVFWVGASLFFYRMSVVRQQFPVVRPRRADFMLLRPGVNLGGEGRGRKPKSRHHRVWNDPGDDEQ
jgi:hypothetical protein